MDARIEVLQTVKELADLTVALSEAEEAYFNAKMELAQQRHLDIDLDRYKLQVAEEFLALRDARKKLSNLAEKLDFATRQD